MEEAREDRLSSLCCPMRDMFMFLVSCVQNTTASLIISSSMRIITSMETSVDGYMVRWIALRLQGEQHKSSNVRIIYANKEIRVNA